MNRSEIEAHLAKLRGVKTEIERERDQRVIEALKKLALLNEKHQQLASKMTSLHNKKNKTKYDIDEMKSIFAEQKILADLPSDVSDQM